MNASPCLSPRACLGALCFALALSWASAQTGPPAFPGAQGFGRFATGGRGGTVYHVTNLNDSGTGSFRDAVTTPNRTVVFDVGGVIRITSVISVANNVTIAGQTAPGDGVTIYGHRLSYSGANNTITRFIRVRMGINGDGNDTITIANGHDMIFDHLSVSWGQDETFSVSGSSEDPTNITIEATIISQGLQTHSAGGLIQTSGGVSILRSFYIDNHTRNPKVKGVNEYVNNVVYNWEVDAYILGDSAGQSYANVINNYFIDGPGSTATAFDRGNLNFHLFATNNWQDSNLNGVLDGAMLTQAQYDVNDWQTVPYPYPATNALEPLTALKLAVSDVGASWHRDTVDERMLTELTSWGILGETINSEYAAPMNGPGTVRNGTPYADTDQDGMPDYWELGTGSNPNVANHNDPSPSGSGYTRLEDYLNWLADPHGVALTNTTVNVDLRQFTRGFTNTTPVYSVTAATNGSVTLLAGHFAQFVPAAGYIGPAGFLFTVVDAGGSTISRPMNLFFTPLAQPLSPVWRGDDSANNWNLLGDYNWFDGQSLLYPFHPGDSARFDDTGSTRPNVNLVGSLQPVSVTVDAGNNYTFSGAGSLDGSMSLTKTGAGTLTLMTTNNFTGSTTISNGALLVHGSLNQSLVDVLSGGVLGGNGRLGVPPVLQPGSAIAPGSGIGSAGTLTITNGLTESGGVLNRFDLSDDPSGLVKTNDRLRVIGDLSLSGTNTISVNLLNGPLANGVYTLITYTGAFFGGLSNLALLGANGVLTNPPGAIALSVGNTRAPANLVWLGVLPNNIWDTGTNANWLNGVNQDRFYFMDAVRFDDSGSTNTPVTVARVVSPASVTVDATKNYVFSGSGKISGTTGLAKTNSGTLTVLTTNDYTGITAIGSGVVSVSQLANSGLPCGLGAAGADPTNLVFNGGTLRYTGPTTSTERGATLTSAGGSIDIATTAATLTMSNVIAGVGPLNKVGAGKLSLSAANTFAGGLTVTEGTAILGTDAGFGSGAITLNGDANGATLQFGINAGTLNNTLNVLGTNNFTVNNVNNTVNDMTGSGTLILNTGATFTFAGNMNGFSGTLVVGTITNPRFNPSTGSPSATFDLGNTSALLNNRNGGLTIQLGALIGGPNTILQGASLANSLTTYVVGGKNLSTTFAGKITEVIPARTVAIVKTGTGTFTLTGANTYTGTTTVNGGTLLINNTAGTGTGTNSVTVNNTGTLGGTGFILGPVTLNTGGSLAPGSNGIGTLTLRSNLTLNSGSFLNFELGPTNASDKVVVGGNVVLGGSFNVTNQAGFGAGTYLLITNSGTLSGPLPAIGAAPAGYGLTLNTNTPGQVRLVVAVTAQPRFSSAVLAGTNLMFGGTNGTASGNYYLLTATNVALPATNWTRAATNLFDSAGAFLFTNSVQSGQPRKFYRLQLP